jgi:hypothetical protein
VGRRGMEVGDGKVGRGGEGWGKRRARGGRTEWGLALLALITPPGRDQTTKVPAA